MPEPSLPVIDDTQEDKEKIEDKVNSDEDVGKSADDFIAPHPNAVVPTGHAEETNLPPAKTEPIVPT